jgi:hypothetical protein
LTNNPYPRIREIWSTSFGGEIEHMAQGDDTRKTKGNDCIFVINHTQLAYARILADFRPQK